MRLCVSGYRSFGRRQTLVWTSLRRRGGTQDDISFCFFDSVGRWATASPCNQICDEPKNFDTQRGRGVQPLVDGIGASGRETCCN
jgi:hypothetical protein